MEDFLMSKRVTFAQRSRLSSSILATTSFCVPMYSKNARRSSSQTPRYKARSKSDVSEEVIPYYSLKKFSPPQERDSARIKSPASPYIGKDGSLNNNHDKSGAKNLLSPGTPERRRSRSLCQTQMQADAQAVAAAQHAQVSAAPAAPIKENGRKKSEGLVPNMNRLRIVTCYKNAKPQIGEAILKRSSASRPEIRGFLARLSDEQHEEIARTLYDMITDAVENIDKTEKVLAHGRRVGELFAQLCPLGFRPDYFAPIADAAIAECVKLDGGTHKRCETLLAWSQLMSALFSAVRDGYYQRIRFQRRASLPQHQVQRQQSIDSRHSADQQTK